MTTRGADAGLPRILRMGERSAVVPAPEGVEATGTRPDPGAGSNRQLPDCNLTEHIQSANTGREQAIPSLPRECDCPRFVTRCVHIESRVLCLCIDDIERCCETDRPTCEFVVLWRDELLPCPVSNTLTHLYPFSRLYFGDSEADALTAFYAAEQQLLQSGGDA